MYTVYVIENSLQKIYIGLTGNFKKRLISHRAGENTYSKKLGCIDYKLVHKWDGLTDTQAFYFERWLHRLSQSDVMDIILDCPIFNSSLEEDSLKMPLPPIHITSQTYRTQIQK